MNATVSQRARRALTGTGSSAAAGYRTLAQMQRLQAGDLRRASDPEGAADAEAAARRYDAAAEAAEICAALSPEAAEDVLRRAAAAFRRGAAIEPETARRLPAVLLGARHALPGMPTPGRAIDLLTAADDDVEENDQ